MSLIFAPEGGPLVGDTYTCKDTGHTYEWCGQQWNSVVVAKRDAPPAYPEDGPNRSDEYICERTGARYAWYGRWFRVDTSDEREAPATITKGNVTREEGPWDDKWSRVKGGLSDEKSSRGELSDVAEALRDLAIFAQGARVWVPDAGRLSIRVVRKGVWLSRVPPTHLYPRAKIHTRFIPWDKAHDFAFMCAKLKELLDGV